MSKDDPDIKKRKQERQQKKAAENVAAATVADRLTNRAKTQIVNVPMQDDAGNFDIPMHIPSVGDTYDLTQFEDMMQDQEGRERMATMMTDLSVDPSMDYNFWLNGSIGLLDLRLLIEGLTSASLQRMKEVKSFRKE